MKDANLGRKFCHAGYVIELHYKFGNPAIITHGWRPGSTRPHVFSTRERARLEARRYRGVCDRVMVRRVDVKITICQEIR